MPSTRANKKLVAVTVTLAVLAALTVPLAGTAVANHVDRTLEIGNCTTNPALGAPCGDTNAAIMANEIESNEVQQTHTIRAVLRNVDGDADAPADATSGPINIDFEIESGPADSDANDPIPPDLTCSVAIGGSSCEVQYSSSQTGTNTIRAWIDHDTNNNQIVNDPYDGTEARFANTTTDCGVQPPATSPECLPTPSEPVPNEGGIPEPDGTDVIRKTWNAGPAARLDCEPELATNPSTGSGSSETYTCTVTDSLGNPKNGIQIDGENLAGANDPDNNDFGNATPDYDHQNPNETSGGRHFCTTGPPDFPAGQCSDVVDAIDAEAGSADICFWADAEDPDGDGTPNPDSLYAPGGMDQTDGGDCDLETQGQNDLDLTDTVTKTWQVRSAAQGGVDAEPETDTNDVNTDHTITGHVYDQFGAPFQGNTTVNFEFFSGSPSDPPNDGNSPNTPDMSCPTSNSTSCTETYRSAEEGTDLICVWINSAPTMSGNNTNGTCDGGNGPEGLNDPDDAAGTADPPDPPNDDVDVVQKIWQDPGAATRLDCSPETDTNSVGTAHTITCKATNAAGTGISGANVDGEVTGANDPDNGNSPTSPDFTCNTASDDPLTPTTNEAGNCTFTHGQGGTGTTNSAGLTTYRFWIDADGDNATTEADASEGRDETATAGADQEPDDTDVVEKSWVAAPASLSIAPETDTANVGTCNAYTITALNAQNQPAQGATIDIEQRHERAQNATQNDEPRVSFCTPTSTDGPNPSAVDDTKGDLRPPDENPDNVGTAGGETVNSTDAQGKVTIGITIAAANNSDGTGTVNLSAFFETTDNDDPDSGEPQDTATKTWEKNEPRTIDCEPETASNALGTSHTVTCTARDRNNGQPVAGEGVTFTEEGPGEFSGPSEQTTDSSGQATATVTSQEEGTQTITGTLTDDTTGAEPGEVDECDKAANDPQGAPAGVCSDAVTKTWSTQQPECNDGVDNDGDGEIDHPDDPGCQSSQDDDETDQPRPPKRVDSDIKGFDHGSPFSGRVTSPSAKCERGRKAVVKKVRPGKDKKIGSDRTNRRGRFKVGHNRPHGDGKFYAKVKAKRFTNNRGRVIICTKARSKRITVR